MAYQVRSLPAVKLAIGDIGFKTFVQVENAPEVVIDRDTGCLVYLNPDYPHLSVTNSRRVFTYTFSTGRQLYLRNPGFDGDIVLYHRQYPETSSRWNKQAFDITYEQGFALYDALDREEAERIETLRERQ